MSPVLLVLISAGLVLLAALVTRPLAESAGPGRLVAFALLSIAGAAGALVLTTSGVLPGTEDAEETGERTEQGERALELMIADLETQAGVPVVEAPSVEQLAEAEGPSVWRLEGVSVLCLPTDFPDSAEMVCWAPNVMVAEGVKVDDTIE